MKKLLILAPLALLAACGSKPAQEESTTIPEAAGDANIAAPAGNETAAADAAPAAFAQCGVCHKVEKDGGNGVGPNLHGIVGRKAGTLAGFSYSPGMTASGLTWDEATLDTYLADPRAKVPGTKMSFAGEKDAAKRAEIIAWLKKNS